MIPQKLSLQGIYSFRQLQVIDFNHLIHTGLFGIFGNVGSGKSSIIEAITFVLYQMTERLNKGDKRTYNMMNLKSDSMYIEFEFMAGEHNHRYRFVYKAKRNSKKFEDVNTKEYKKYIFTNNEWLPIEQTTEDIIGLSYENFKRTIIIPQNKFQEFLELGDDARSQMMKEVFRLEKYDLSSKISDFAALNKNKKHQLSGEIDALEHCSIEQLQNLENDFNRIIKSIDINKKTIETLQNDIKVLNQIQSWHHSWQQILLESDAILRLKTELDRREKDYKLYQDVELKFKSDFIEQKRLKQLIENETKENEKYKHELKLILQEKAELESQRADLDKHLKNKPELLSKITNIPKIMDIKSLDDEILKNLDRQKNGKLEIEKCKNDLKNIDVNIKQLEQFKVELLKQIVDDKPLIDNKIKLIEIKSKDIHIDEKQTQIESLKQQILIKEKEFMNMCFKNNIEISIDNFKNINNILNNLKKENEDKKTSIDQQISTLEGKKYLQNLHLQLKPGEPCLMCGSTSHLNHYTLDFDNVELDTYIALKNQLEKNIEQCNTLLFKFENLELNKNETAKQILELQSILEKLKYERQTLDSIKPQDIDIKLSEIDEKIAIIKHAEKEKLDIENKIVEHKNAAEEIKKKIERYNDVLKEFERNVDNYKGQKEMLLSQIKADFYKIYIEKNIEMLKNEQAELVNFENELENKDKENTIKWNDNRDRLNINQTQISAIAKALEKSKSALEQLNSKIEIILTDFENLTIPQIVQILNKNIDLEPEKAWIETNHKKIIEYNYRKLEYEEKLKHNPYNELLHKSKFDELAKTEQEFNQNIELKGKYSQQIDALNQNFKKREKIEKELVELTLKIENIEKINRLIYGNRFINYISTSYLNNLCAIANERFSKLTYQQLQLELNETNNFVIRDYANNGELRSVKTLSGGQKFQAALCLALALSDSVSSRNMHSKNFFFLDEGFGSLDKDALEIVYQTLKNLQKENRVVGIISHVSEMQNEIDTHLLISNTDSYGSLINESWKY